jgi:hypothetical protein
MNAAVAWTGNNVTVGPIDDATYTQTAFPSTTFTVAASQFGTITRYMPGDLDLDTIVGGDDLVKADDYITFFIRTDRPDLVVFVQLDIDIDSGTFFPGNNAFQNNYYSVRIPSLGRLNQGIGTWTTLQIRKSEFARFGTDTTRDWRHTRTFRYGIQTLGGGAVRINVQRLQLRGGIGLEGSISYTVCYRNTATGARGNPPKAADFTVLHTLPLTVDRQRISIDISNIRTGGVNSPARAAAEEIDTIIIYRQGGTFTSYVKVAEIPFTTASPYIDTISDETLVLTADTLELDNDLPPIDTTNSQRYIFGPDGTGHYFMIVDGYKLYFCKPYETLENRIENWPRLNFAFIGDGSSKAIAGCCEGAQTFVWTDTWTYNVVGIGAETYLPVRIDGSRGIVGQNAWTSGEGSIFFVSQDGIYAQNGQQQQKITGAIDPFFQGLTVAGQLGWHTNPAVMALVQLEFLHEPTGPTLTMLYADSSSTSLNQILVIKPNIQSGTLTECFFDYSTLTTAQCVYLDTYNKQLLAGGADGHIYRLHDPATYFDVTEPITFRVRTQSSVCGDSSRSKYVDSVVVEGSTFNQSLQLAASYERGETTEVLGTVAANSETALTFLPTIHQRTLRHDIALELTGETIYRFAIVRLGGMFEPQPTYITFFDSGDITFDFVTQLKILLCDLNNFSTLNLRLYLDQAIGFEGVILSGTSRILQRYALPAGLRARVFRVTLTSAVPFLVYKVTGLVKQLGIERDYTEHLFMQGT